MKAEVKVCKRRELSDTFPVHNHPKQGDALSTLLFNFLLEYTQQRT
jgi:hypothetical protein